MALSNERLVGDQLPSTNGTLYTVPAAKKVSVTSITLANTGSSTRTVTITLAGIAVISAYSLEAHETFGLSIAHVLYTTELIEGFQTAGTDVDVLISGVTEDV